jgi:serine/threonine protein kinase
VEVYRARDARLGRDVALKILPTEMANYPARRQRFEQEARAIAALNHPNIAAIYAVGEGYFVSELIAGGSLGSFSNTLSLKISASKRPQPQSQSKTIFLLFVFKLLADFPG